MGKPKVIVICGPTASGKTALSIQLAKKINGEIISADSMQIYKEMDIGTAKPTITEMEGIKHYLIDCVSPEEPYSVAKYKKDATKVIEEIIKKGKVPIIVGGTGLYINSLIYNIEYKNVEIDFKYREELENLYEEKGLDYLYELAKKIDLEAAEKISCNDKKRIFRILEIYRTTGKTKTEQEKESRKIEPKYDYKIFAINMEREILYNRINQRVNLMIESGLIEEVEKLTKRYKEMLTAIQGLGYKEVVEYLKNKISKEEMIEKIKMETRRYAKRQLTWFKQIKDITWLDGLKSKQNNVNIILEVIK